MPIKSNLNVFPYFDDYSQDKDFYKVLFKPSVSVQVRELNQLQTMVQTQIERFGDNIFRKGTILDGCAPAYYTPYPYIKLADTQVDGSLVIPDQYLGKFVVDETTGLRAYVVNYADGYELSDPDLKTLYITYNNSGTSGNVTQFTPGNTVTIKDGKNSLYKIDVVNGGSGFSNNDQIIITPALLVNVTSGTLTTSDYLIQPSTGANVEVLSVNTTAITGKALITYKPLDSALTNASSNSTNWTFTQYASVQNDTGSVLGTVEQIYGENAVAILETTATGIVKTVAVLNGGKNYDYVPVATIKTSNSSAGINTLDLSPKNYYAKIKLPGAAATVGNGYAFGISEGVIYQAGHMLRVAPQTIVVQKYSTSPNNVVACFSVNEEFVDFTKDSSLLDNALGTENETAPGADRLKLTPKLQILTKEDASANDEIFTLVEWNDGFPYKQNLITQYSRLGDVIADTQYDSTGNFVMDAFQVTTESVSNSALEGTYYTVVIDPGQAYINGRKVQTTSNYKVNITKGLDTRISNNNISLNYGNYFRVKELAGDFDFSGGGEIKLYNREINYVSNTTSYTSGTITPQGRLLGSAKLRSVELESGIPGTASAVYRVYIFDLSMNAGENVKDTRSLYYDGTVKGIADIALSFDASSQSNVALLNETKYNSLLFSAGVESLKNSNNTTYTYRTAQTVSTTISTGVISLSLDGGSDEYFPYTGDLSGSQLQELIVVPTAADLVSINLTGTVTINTSSNSIIGSSTNFLNDFEVGDYIQVSNGSSTNIRRIINISNTTQLQLDTVPTVANTASGTFKRAFPRYIPVPFGQRTGLYANVDVSTGKTLTIKFRHSNSAAIAFDYGSATLGTKLSFNVERRNVSSSLKTANRSKYVKIRIANNTGNTVGPWCIGVPDAMRLRAVYIGNSSVNTSFSDVVSNFYIDHNQNANYLGLGYLYKSPRSNLTVSNDDYLLVCFDYFTRDNAGYYDTRSYLRTANTANVATIDSLTFGQISNTSISGGSASSWEVPEVYTYDDDYYDLLNQIDFRPACDATASPNAVAGSAPTNPSETITFTGLSKFPKPNSIMRTQIEQYIGRNDDVYIGESGNIYVMKGIADVNPRKRISTNHPKDSLKLQTLAVPPYPNICRTTRPDLGYILRTNVSNEKDSNLRIKSKTITPLISTTNLQTSQPMVYTMENIANLERRIKDLEYYVSLSLLETGITNKIIPSSIDGSLNRFKFGFFADDFTAQIYSDVNNPQYAATIESEGEFEFGFNGSPLEPESKTKDYNNPLSTAAPQPSKTIQRATNRLVPPKHVWSLKHFSENLFFVDEPIIEQNNATLTINPCVIDTENEEGVIGEAVYVGVNRRQSTIYMEDISGTVTVYFQFYQQVTDTGTYIKIQDKSGNIIASSLANKNDVKSLTASDLSYITTNSLAQNYYNAITTTNVNQAFTRLATTDYAYGTGKIEFQGVAGEKYIISIFSTQFSPNYKYLVRYPSILAAGTNVINTPECDPNPPRFEGTLQGGKLTIQQWSCSNNFRVNSTSYKAFVLEATGLKPNTIHKLYLDSQEWTNTILMKQSLLTAAFYEPRRFYSMWGSQTHLSGATISGESVNDVLVTSWVNKVNEVGRFLNIAMSKLYDSNGNPTQDTIIQTDASGKCKVLVFFPLDFAGWFSQDFNAPSYALNYTGFGFNEAENTSSTAYSDLTGYNAYLKPTVGSMGYTAISLESANRESVAVRVFANRTPNKILPSDPKGSI